MYTDELLDLQCTKLYITIGRQNEPLHCFFTCEQLVSVTSSVNPEVSTD